MLLMVRHSAKRESERMVAPGRPIDEPNRRQRARAARAR